jgi:uncharacterized protein
MVVRLRHGTVWAEVVLLERTIPVKFCSLKKRRGVAPMTRRFARLFAFVLALSCAGVFLSLTSRVTVAQTADEAAATAAATAQWQQDLGSWRSQREKEISAPDGWLTLAGLEWLKPGINSVGSAADNKIRLPGQAPEHLGLLTVSGGAAGKEPASAAIVQILAPAGGFPPELTLDGKPAREGSLRVDDAKPSTIAWRGLSMVVLRRGDRFVLRIKDADSPVRAGFRGLNWYAPDPRYRVTARWIPFKPRQIEEIPTVIGTTLKLPAPGLAMFLLDGQILHLEPVLEDPSGKTLFFILRDETSKTTTYGGGRFLHAGPPDHGLDQPGNLTLDFNRLENPPCAYTVYATCPLPPVQNQLGVAIEAGERRYER